MRPREGTAFSTRPAPDEDITVTAPLHSEANDPSAAAGGSGQPALAAASDDFLRTVLAEAELPALLPALAQATGDLRLVDETLRPAGGPLGVVPVPQGGMSAEAQARARMLALEAMQRLRDGTATGLDVSDERNLMRLLEFMTGPISPDYLPLLIHELGLTGDMGAPRWRAGAAAPGRELRVVVIGAGMCGLGVAHRLLQAQVDVVVLEKNDDVGGTWYENSYPGCRLDTPNFCYSYSFLQRKDWPQAFTERRHLHRYFRDAAEMFGLLDRIRFRSTVEQLVYDEGAGQWTIAYRDADGQVHWMTADVVISAVGQLNQPHVPTLPGIETFRGEAWHTARWRHDRDLTGLKVAVVGTGASAFQVIPTIVDQVGAMTVFQRTPPWIYPAPDYHAEIPRSMRWLFEHVPKFHRWYRFLQFYVSLEGRLRFMRVDPAWRHPVSVSAKNDELRIALQAYLESEFADRPDLLAHAVPGYPPGAKRMLRDNGIWARALKAPHVSLVTAGIDRVEPNGIRDRDGRLHEADVIIWGTGFKASNFLIPMQIIGRGGVNLHQKWGGDLRAYYGVLVPEFPNLMLLYGPNTNLVVNGSLVFIQEMGIEFIVDMIGTMLAKNLKSLEIGTEAFAAYNRWVDEGNAGLSWGASSVSSWYKNAAGRVTQNWPYSMLDYWKGTHDWRLSDFLLKER